MKSPRRPLLLEFAVAPPAEPKCDAKRGPRSKTTCELPPGHLGRHLGRSRSGKWFSWA